MAHKTMIGGTAYEIGGGNTLINGTGYSIDKGKTLVGGTAYEVGFDAPITIRITKDFMSGNTVAYCTINGKQYKAGDSLSASTTHTVSVPVGTVVSCLCSRNGWGDANTPTTISVNGTNIISTYEKGNYTYDYTVKGKTLIVIDIVNGDGCIAITET